MVKVKHKFQPGHGIGQVTKQITKLYVIVEWGPPTNSSSMEPTSNLEYISETIKE